MKDKEKKAQEAIDASQKISYTTGTSGWGMLVEEIEKEKDWAFNKSVSTEFKKEVLKNPSAYAEHCGYVAGIKKMIDVANKIVSNGEKAKKDIEKWEALRKSRRL